MQRAIITGANGLLGRQLASQLTEKGWAVTAVIRGNSDRAPLEKLGAKPFACDLSIDKPPNDALRDADVVFHAAAAVSDWAPWSHFEANTVRATENICAAAVEAGCRRFVHISTVGVYGRPRSKMPATEGAAQHWHGRWDHYRHSKILAEQIVWRFQQQRRLTVSVIRPAMMYGPGDRAFLGRIIPLLRAGKLRFVGDPSTCLPLVHVQDVANAVVFAATRPDACGEAFNVVNPEQVSQKDFLNTIASLIDAAPVTKRVPYRLAYGAGLVSELFAHLFRSANAPRLTRYRVTLLGCPRTYSIEKIRARLGWRPTIGFNEGIREAVQWNLHHGS
jgi:nucleoside-diphosphate-sugar epimerase